MHVRAALALALLPSLFFACGGDDDAPDSALTSGPTASGRPSIQPLVGETTGPSPSPSALPATATAVPPTTVPPTAIPPTAVPPTPAPAVLACTATASVSNAAPTKNSQVTVTGNLSCTGGSPSGATMATSWAYKSTTSTCEGVANATGTASCSRNIGTASSGYTVAIAVTFTLDGKTFRANTAFTPQ